jgi:hypothetical protein
MLLVFAVVGPFSSSSSYNTATHYPIKQVQFRCVGTSIAHPFFVSNFLSFFLSLKQEHLLFVCFCFKEKQNKQTFFFKENLLC